MPVKIKRLSDGATHDCAEFGPKSFVKSLKHHIKNEFLPKFPNGCRLKFQNKVLKSRHRLEHYNIYDNDTIEMDDRKNWSSSSSSSNSEK
jgi:hypothetical protein